jgi:hypothetical protein
VLIAFGSGGTQRGDTLHPFDFIETGGGVGAIDGIRSGQKGALEASGEVIRLPGRCRRVKIY